MTPSSTAVATKEEENTDLVEISAEEQALIAANQAEVDASEFVIPILKLAQPLTDEVSAGKARPGEYVLPLTGQSFEGPVEVVISGKGKGRFKPGGKGQRTLVAYDTATVPETWGDDPFVGQPFAEHPDAEEQYKAAVDRKERQWESGPPIQTTFNYTGYIVGEDVPIRLSLRRTSAPTARKWNTLLDAVLNGRFWDKVFVLDSEQQKNDQGAFYVATVELGRAATAEEKQKAIKLAVALRNQQVRTVGEEASDDAPTVEPDAAGGLDV